MNNLYYTSTTEEDIKNIDDNLMGMKEYNATLLCSSRASDLLISRALQMLLKSIYKEDLHQSLEFILNELVSNASKANLKREYFKVKKLDINRNNDYQRGMRSFFKDVFGNFSKYENSLKVNKHYIKIKIKILEGSFKLTVTNSSELLEIEKHHIIENISLARKFNTINEVYKKTNSYNEGSGYGLILIILLLRKLQLQDMNLKYTSKDGTTSFCLELPLDLISQEEGEIIADEIVKEIDSMPQFPDNIQRLQVELNDPDCNFNRISDLVLSDTNLSTEVLRIANSPVFRGTDNTDKISVAVSKIGLLGLRAILYNYGANKVFSMKYDLKCINTIKEHQFSVALISAFLSNYKNLNNFAEDIFVAGLIHDMGKIIVNALNSDLIEMIDKVCRDKKISISIIDNLAEGYNHSTIGYQLAQKWNFPDKYINSIKYHHNPLDAPEEFKPITYSIYLGNEIYHYLKGERKYSSINLNILKFFDFDTEDKFNKFINAIKSEGINI